MAPFWMGSSYCLPVRLSVIVSVSGIVGESGGGFHTYGHFLATANMSQLEMARSAVNTTGTRHVIAVNLQRLKSLYGEERLPRPRAYSGSSSASAEGVFSPGTRYRPSPQRAKSSLRHRSLQNGRQRGSTGLDRHRTHMAVSAIE